MLKPTKIWRIKDTLLFRKPTKKALIRLRGSAGCSAPLLLASNKVRISRIEAHMLLKPRFPGLRLATRLNTTALCVILSYSC